MQAVRLLVPQVRAVRLMAMAPPYKGLLVCSGCCEPREERRRCWAVAAWREKVSGQPLRRGRGRWVAGCRSEAWSGRRVAWSRRASVLCRSLWGECWLAVQPGATLRSSAGISVSWCEGMGQCPRRVRKRGRLPPAARWEL